MADGFEEDIAQLWALLFEIVLDGEKRLAAYLSSHGLTTPQFYVLKTLVEHEGQCSIGEIARTHGLTGATMTGLIKRLEAQSPPLVARTVSEADRRAVNVRLTQAGQARFMAVQEELFDYIRQMFCLLEAPERKRLLQYLRRYVDLVVAGVPVHHPG